MASLKQKSRSRKQTRDNKEKSKRELFVREKMWVSYLLSNFFKDRGRIPENIGNNILVTNNMYISSVYLSSIIQINTLSNDTPVTLVGELNNAIRVHGIPAILDVTFRNSKFDVQLKDSGLNSRIRMWENTLEAEDSKYYSTETQKARAIALLYTVNEAKKGKQLYKTRIFVTIRAKTRTNLQKAEDVIIKYLDSISANYTKVIDVKENLRYMSAISNRMTTKSKDIVPVITSETVLSQMFVSSSYNDNEGLFLAMDKKTNTPFKLNIKDITVARNIMLVAPSGVGKTVIALNICESSVEDDMCVCIMDIKGNEFTNFTESHNGVTVSLRATSDSYINTFKMHKDEVKGKNPTMYFNERVNFSKKQMIILVGFTGNEVDMAEEILDDFFDRLYIALGVVNSNPNTWNSTLVLDAYTVFDYLENYICGSSIINSNVGSHLYKSLKIYMSRKGTKNYLFRNELNYYDILDTKVLRFDFGILENNDASSIDPNIYALKLNYMSKLNGEYITRKYDEGKKVLKVLEEAQMVSDAIRRVYMEEYTLRRAQGQTTLLLGNSIEALVASPITKPIIENTKGILIGALLPTALETAIKEFDLEPFRQVLESVGSTEELENSFVFVNRMQSNPVLPILKLQLDKKKKYKLFTPSKSEGGN